MNKKGVQLALSTMIVVVVLLLLLAFVGLPWIMKIRSGTATIQGYSSCEKPIGSNYGMCYNSGCPNENSQQLGTLKGGCPSTQIKSALKVSKYKDEQIEKYSQCCIIKKCSDLVDAGGSRKKGCYIKSKCKDKYDDNVFDSINKCVGQAEDCLAKDGCCCILG